MAEIVLGIGSSHSPLLNSPAEDYPRHAEIDASGRKLIDKTGKPRTYGELLEQADPSIKDQIRPEVLQERAARCTANIERLERELAGASLDALIIIGDDQHEQFFDDNMPAILVYAGETIVNNPLNMPEEAPQWWRRARSQYHVSDEPREFPVASGLARHIVESLMDRDFDVSFSRKLSKAHGEGHAFGFVHQRLMREDAIVPIVPVALNTYFPPNQPRPRRCYELGRAIAASVRAFEGAGARRHPGLGRAEPFHRRRGTRSLSARRVSRQGCGRAARDHARKAQFRHLRGAELDYGRRGVRASGHEMAGLRAMLPFGGGHRLRHGLCGLELKDCARVLGEAREGAHNEKNDARSCGGRNR